MYIKFDIIYVQNEKCEMTLFFDILLLERQTKCNPHLMLDTLKLWSSGNYLPKNSKDKIKITKSLHGKSFLLNPKPFFDDKSTDILYKIQYLRLAGRRDYAQYRLLDAKYLDLSYYTDISISAIQHNPLLRIENKKLHFKYEE